MNKILKKILKYFSVFIITSIIAAVIIYISVGLLFVHKELLLEIKLPKRDYNLEIFYVGTGATSADVIQVKRVYNIFNSEIIDNIKGYQTIKAYRMIDSSTIEIQVGIPGNEYSKSVILKY